MVGMGAVILVLLAATGHVERLDAPYNYRARARAYDPSLGRFLQRDPIGIWGDGINFGNGYAYVGGDPVNGRDPEGKWNAPEHTKLTQSACISVNLDNGCCDAIIKANVDTDGSPIDGVRWYGGKELGDDDVKHFLIARSKNSGRNIDRDEALLRYIEYMKKTLLSGTEYAKECKCEEAIKMFGQALHSYQDSIAHKNSSGMPITEDEHRYDLSYDDPNKNWQNYAKAKEYSIDLLETIKDTLGCCCGDTPAPGQKIPCLPNW